MYIIFAKKFPYQSHQLEVDKGRPSIQFDIPQFSNLTVNCTNLMQAMLDVDADVEEGGRRPGGEEELEVSKKKKEPHT